MRATRAHCAARSAQLYCGCCQVRVARRGRAAFRAREAVFSSTGFRIRAAQPTAATAPVARWAERAAASLFFTLFPADCRICGSPLIEVSRLPVCKDCVYEPALVSSGVCGICGEACDFPPSLAPADALCRYCRKARPPFQRAVAYGNYEGGLRELIHLLKFDHVRPVASVLGGKLAEAIAALEPSLPSGTITVVPVPLHTKKLAQRGFNQAKVTARAALKELERRKAATAERRSGRWWGRIVGAPSAASAPPSAPRFELCLGVLTRARETVSQIGLTRHQRRENLRGAFVVHDPTPIGKRNILLVDDVYTTGATASACSQALLKAGAAAVWVATVARTQRTNAGLMNEDAPQEENQNEAERGLVAS